MVIFFFNQNREEPLPTHVVIVMGYFQNKAK